MTADQRRETALRLYRACFTTPSEAKDPSVFTESWGGSYNVSDGAFVKVFFRHSGYVKVMIEKSGSGLNIHGSLESIEATLAAIPTAMKVQS